MGKRRKGSGFNKLVFLTVGGLVAASVVQELRKPEAERTWHGDVFGLVPYDYRVPTVRKLRSTYWAPEDERIVMPKAFGVGWDVNVGRLVRLATQSAA